MGGCRRGVLTGVLRIVKCCVVRVAGFSPSVRCAVCAVQLGWKPLLNSYMKTLPDTIDEENRKLIIDLFDWLVQPCLGTYVCTVCGAVMAVCVCVCVCVCACVCVLVTVLVKCTVVVF